MKRSVFIICLFLVACAVNRQFMVTKFGYYKIEVPRGHLNHLIISGNHGQEYQYWYKDSMLLYFSYETGIATPNQDNINQDPELRNIRTKALLENDTFYLEGKDDKNLFWKECFYRDITIGYMNVPNDEKEIFDKAISSLKKK